MLYDAIEILLPDLCSALECTSTEVKPDSLGFLWCEDCSEWQQWRSGNERI